MKWVNPNDEMPKRYITILIAIQYPQHNRAFTITTGLYTGDRMGWYADVNGKYLDTEQVKYWAPIAPLPRDY